MNANLKGARFNNANLKGAFFNDADLTGTDFNHVSNLTIAQLHSAKNWRKAKNIPTNIK
jgi:uncharacterized protein YjbI with pentapeptide repeats